MIWNNKEAGADKLDSKWSAEIMGHGFTAVPNLLIERRDYLNITPSEFYILIVLEKFRWNPGEMPWPTIKTLAEVSGFDERTITRITKSMEDKVLIRKIHRHGRSVVYDLTPMVEELHGIACR